MKRPAAIGGALLGVAVGIATMRAGIRAEAQDAVPTAQAANPPQGEQTVLGPGLYVFQTRTRSASCGDDERTGYVSSFYAAIHGVPGSRTMRMQLLNSPYWSTWTLAVGATDAITGDAYLDGSTGTSRPHSHFEVTLSGDRFTGEGTRAYDVASGGSMRRCVVTYDALLRRLDM